MVRQLNYDDDTRACFLVRAEGAGGMAHDYLWLLSRQEEPGLEGCWMTDAVLMADHGLLSFLHLIAPPVCVSGGPMLMPPAIVA